MPEDERCPDCGDVVSHEEHKHGYCKKCCGKWKEFSQKWIEHGSSQTYEASKLMQLKKL